jgi:hypothetical protein
VITASGPLPNGTAAVLVELEATFGGTTATPWGWAALDPGADWPGWYVHAYGPSGLWDTRQGTPRVPFVVCNFSPDPSQPEIRSAVQIWVFRAGRDGSPVALERRCKLGMEERVALVGLDQPHAPAQVRVALSGLKLIGHAQDLPPIGRPVGSGDYPDEQTFRSTVEPLIRSLRKHRGRATRDAAAEELSISSDYLKDLTHDLIGRTWPEYVKTVPDKEE